MSFFRIKGQFDNNISGIFASLHSKNYRLYFFGQGISLIGTWMHNVALSWLIYRLTGSVFLLGLIGFTSQIPTFFLAPFTGVFTDRHNRHWIMVGAQILFMIQASVMATLVLTEHIEVWHIILLSLIFGVISAFDAPARQALVVDLIDNPKNIGNAIALNSAIFNGARLVGPAIAGMVIAAAGEGICFLINALSFVAVIVALLAIKIEHKRPKGKREPFLESFVSGLAYTYNTLPIRRLITLLAMLSIAGFPFIVLLPAYAKEVLGGGAKTLGFLMSSLGVGALAGALFMASVKGAKNLYGFIPSNTVILGIAITLASFAQSSSLAMPALVIGGFSMIMSLSSVNTLLQTITQEDKRGRVMSFYAMALMGTLPIGNLLAGSFADMTSVPIALFIGGVATVISGLWYGKVSKNELSEKIECCN